VKSWLDSKTIKYLILQWVVSFATLLGIQLQKHEIDWWTLGAVTLTSIAGIVSRMLQDDVEAPFDWMNKKV